MKIVSHVMAIQNHNVNFVIPKIIESRTLYLDYVSVNKDIMIQVYLNVMLAINYVNHVMKKILINVFHVIMNSLDSLILPQIHVNPSKVTMIMEI